MVPANDRARGTGPRQAQLMLVGFRATEVGVALAPHGGDAAKRSAERRDLGVCGAGQPGAVEGKQAVPGQREGFTTYDRVPSRPRDRHGKAAGFGPEGGGG